MTSTPSKEKEATAPAVESKDAKPEPAPPVLSVEDGELIDVLQVTDTAEILNNITLIGRAVSTIEPRFTTRVLRTLTHLRKKLTKPALKDVLERAFPKGCKSTTPRNCCADETAKTGQALIASPIFDLLPEPPAKEETMEVDEPEKDKEADKDGKDKEGKEGESSTAVAAPPKKYVAPVDQSTQDLIPEAIVYLRLLLVLAALDAGKVAEAGEFAKQTTELVQQANRRTMDQIAAKAYFYLARTYELQGRLAELRP